jgi:ferrochelatase
VRRVVDLGKWNSPHTLCFQSKVGPIQWLKPSLIETVERLAGEDRKHFLIIPISFVTDHIETLHEINIDVRKHALSRGVQQFELMHALNNHPKFIECLTDLVIQQLTHVVEYTTCETLWQENSKRTRPKKCPQYRL